MISKNYLYFITFLYLSFLVRACYAHSTSTPNAYTKEITLGNGKDVSVQLIVAPFDSKDFSYRDVNWWGAEVSPPKTYLKDFKILIDGESQWIRFSSYSDLANIKNIDIKLVNDGFCLTIDGGQTSTHYQAELIFDNHGRIKSRLVKGMIFPDEVWEKTEYSFINRPDM